MRAIELEQHPDATTPTLYTVNGKEVMTGQEWYDRFIRELPRPTIIRRFTTDQWFPRWKVIKAAKKAAGIE